MKNWLLSAILASVPLIAAAQDQSEVYVGDPNYYGQVDVQDSRPEVVNSTPTIVEPAQNENPCVPVRPVYLRVPVIYYQNWPEYCYIFGACGIPVYFVLDTWYLNFYVPFYRTRFGFYGRPGFEPHFFPHGHNWTGRPVGIWRGGQRGGSGFNTWSGRHGGAGSNVWSGQHGGAAANSPWRREHGGAPSTSGLSPHNQNAPQWTRGGHYGMQRSIPQPQQSVAPRFGGGHATVQSPQSGLQRGGGGVQPGGGFQRGGGGAVQHGGGFQRGGGGGGQHGGGVQPGGGGGQHGGGGQRGGGRDRERH